MPGSRYLAGSALTLDRAVRNLVDWRLVTPDQALAMASRNPHELMSKALSAFRVQALPGEVEWGPDLRPKEVRIGPIRRSFAASRLPPG